jgi:hypothetical protein
MLNRIAACTIALVLFAGMAFAYGDDILGTVTAVTNDTFTIKDQANKSVVIMLEKGTKFIKGNKPATKADLQVGVRVSIDAHMDAKMKMLSAEQVTIGSATAKK